MREVSFEHLENIKRTARHGREALLRSTLLPDPWTRKDTIDCLQHIEDEVRRIESEEEDIV